MVAKLFFIRFFYFINWRELKIFKSKTNAQNGGLDMDWVKSAFDPQTYGLSQIRVRSADVWIGFGLNFINPFHGLDWKIIIRKIMDRIWIDVQSVKSDPRTPLLIHNLKKIKSSLLCVHFKLVTIIFIKFFMSSDLEPLILWYSFLMTLFLTIHLSKIKL